MSGKHVWMLGGAGLAVAAALAGPQALAGGVPGNKKILMVCGDENGTVKMCTSVGDIMLKNRLELVMGHHVTTMGHDADDAKMLAAANAADLVVIPESVLSGQVDKALVSTTTPIVSSEAFLQDEFGLVVPPFVPVDPGYPGGVTVAQLQDASRLLYDAGLLLNITVPPPANPTANNAQRNAYRAAVDAAAAAAIAKAPKPSHGVTVDQLDIVITDPSHPLAAGLSGRVRVYTQPREMNWGAHLAPGAHVVATLAPALAAAGDAEANVASDYSSAAVIYFVPKGGKLADGSAAPGLRVQLFVENENGPGTYNLMTDDGLRIFDAAINFALASGT
ncbi:MAG: hypothetical protein U1E56_00030 [Bauldia sp.]